MTVILNTVKEALKFIDAFDGYGMVATDEEQQVARLRDFDLIDDYEDESNDDDEPPTPAAPGAIAGNVCSMADYTRPTPAETGAVEKEDDSGGRREDCGDSSDLLHAIENAADGAEAVGSIEPLHKSFQQICAAKKVLITAFAKRELQENGSRHEEDFWSAFDDCIDVQFCLSDDAESPNFNKREVWAYEIIHDFGGRRGESRTATDTGILIDVTPPKKNHNQI